ncbi:helix-turn-helix domain-containing protein [Paenibacillus sp. BJ-4]|uniref:helix-turn-helix domain-containing protein n=1 Tax=Paenibacillus sp. BJ-4 TaxID=2878097 RepID=UPI001CF02254|nr:helix-turn-helix transcriptional regulator [Paenibacillus sp. BJ-4]
MEHTPTILAELEDYLQRNDVTLAQFAEHSGVHQRTLNNWILKHRPVAVHQLDRITLAMGLPEGYFYERYIEQYIIESSPDWRRIEPVLFRCAEMDKLAAIQRIVGHIMDNLLYSPKLFDAAEQLFAQGRHAAALLLFEGVAEAEKYQHSERLAICQYRIFTIQVGDDQERNLQAALQFQSFVKRLDDMDQLEGMVDLANAFRALRRWDRVMEVAKNLKILAEAQYSMAHSLKREQHKKPLRPLFFYVAFSNSLIGGAYYEQGNYALALQAVYESVDLEWVKETDSETLHWKNLFQEWGEANVCLTKLMVGDREVLPVYADLIARTKDELLPGLWNIMIAANRYNIDVDDILNQFEWEISNIQDQGGKQTNDQQNIDDQLVGILSELADYCLSRGQYEKGVRYLLDGMRKSTIINNERSILRYMIIVERYQKFVLAEAKTEYSNLESYARRLSY